jgi:DNA-binding transcriptional ArsR family regulator
VKAVRNARLDLVLGALADPERREVVEILRERPRASGDLARQMGVSAPTMSRHLRVLRETGLVAEDHGGGLDARVRIYRLTPEPLDGLKSWLAETERLWSRQLLSFKAHLEKSKPRR